MLRRPFPFVPPECIADTNADHRVDALDLSFIIASIRFQTAITPECDLNADSVVDGRDLSILLANFGHTCVE